MKHLLAKLGKNKKVYYCRLTVISRVGFFRGWTGFNDCRIYGEKVNYLLFQKGEKFLDTAG